MAIDKSVHGSYASFDKGIVQISQAETSGKLKLPELTPFKPSDSKIDAKLSKLWKPASLENLLKDSLIPIIKDRDNLTPSIYKKRLQEAKNEFKRLVKEREGRKKKKEEHPFDEEDEDIFEQVVEDMEELETHQDLLWMLRQVVHLA